MKVCHMTSAHAPGDTRIFYKECTSLANAGYEVYLVQRGNSEEVNGVHIVGVGEPSGGRLSRMTGFAKKIYQTAKDLNADVYHFHDPELLPYGLKLKKRGKKVIFDSHEFTVEAILEKQWLPSVLRRIIHFCYKLYETSICKKLDAIITVSPHITEYYKKMNSATVQVANYPAVTKMEYVPDFSEKKIGFAGGITPQWMHENILKALEQVPECGYILCGRCTPSYMEQLQALPGWRQTEYMGLLPHEEVANQLNRCFAGLALLHPSRNTDWYNGTMGNTKIFEEMLAGLPVICTNFTRWREFVERYHCGICVDPENVDEIVAAVRYLLAHLDEARQMGANGRRAVEDEFNWSVEENTLLQLYKDIGVN